MVVIVVGMLVDCGNVSCVQPDIMPDELRPPLNIQDIEVLMFGHGKGLQERVYILYDGTHYNLIVHKKPNGDKVRRFSPTDEQAYQGVLELAKECKSRNEDVDPAIFSLICYECSKGLMGQIDAVEHA